MYVSLTLIKKLFKDDRFLLTIKFPIDEYKEHPLLGLQLRKSLFFVM